MIPYPPFRLLCSDRTDVSHLGSRTLVPPSPSCPVFLVPGGRLLCEQEDPVDHVSVKVGCHEPFLSRVTGQCYVGSLLVLSTVEGGRLATFEDRGCRVSTCMHISCRLFNSNGTRPLPPTSYFYLFFVKYSCRVLYDVQLIGHLTSSVGLELKLFEF